ncbi:MAG: hypothetical protein WCP89_03810, partial [archaeon]
KNTGSMDFQRINITSVGFKDGDIDKNVVISLDKSYIPSLRKGIQENISLTVFFDTNVTGDYEILVDATSQSPRYSDTSKIYISLQEVNQSQVKELILFTENLIASNPECIEIKELLNEAKREMDNKQYESSLKKSQEAIDACKKLISGNILLERPLPTETNLLVYLLYFFGGAFLIVFLYHTYRRMSLRRG